MSRQSWRRSRRRWRQHKWLHDIVVYPALCPDATGRALWELPVLIGVNSRLFNISFKPRVSTWNRGSCRVKVRCQCKWLHGIVVFLIFCLKRRLVSEGIDADVGGYKWWPLVLWSIKMCPVGSLGSQWKRDACFNLGYFSLKSNFTRSPIIRHSYSTKGRIRRLAPEIEDHVESKL